MDSSIVSFEYSRDRALGMIAGLAIGDTIGLPFEYPGKDVPVFTGRVQPYVISLRFVKRKMSTQPSDDTEMSLALLRTLRSFTPKDATTPGEYKRDDVIQAYLRWANGMSLHPKPNEPVYTVTAMGTNTRKVLKGVKTVKGYKKRYLEVQSEQIKSNGSLMRASPYALIKDGSMLAMKDATITNISIVNQHVNFVYVTILSLLVNGHEVTPEIIKSLTDLSVHVYLTIKFALAHDVKGFKRQFQIDSFGGKKKGYVLIGLFLSIRALFTFDSIDEAYRQIVTNPEWGGSGSDSDTNCAIVGAMLGAKFGFAKMMESADMAYNWDRVRYWHTEDRLAELPTDQPKHPDFTLENIEDLI